MQSGEISRNLGALLAIEVGADRTGVVLVDRVEDAFRFIASAERPSTHRPPHGDALAAVCAAISELEQVTGRRLLRDTTLITPQHPDGSGVDAVVAATSDVELLHPHLREALVRVPGLRRLEAFGVEAVGSVVEDQGLMLRFLAARGKRSIWYAGAESAVTLALRAGPQAYDEAIDRQVGLRAGAPEVMRRRGAEAIARWLPEASTSLPDRPEASTALPDRPVDVALSALRNRIMNRALRPQLPSVDADDLALDLALLREAVSDVLGSSAASSLPALLIGGGALAWCPRAAPAALAMLDLLPAARGIVELALDRGMLAAAGAVARIDSTAGAALAGSVQGEPLATAVLLGNTLPIVTPAAHVELVPEGGAAVAVDVRRGEVVRLPLARGKRAELRVRYVGFGSANSTAERRIVGGSTLGIVVDARTGRPALPAASAKRSAALQRWLAALDPATQEGAAGWTAAIPEGFRGTR